MRDSKREGVPRMEVAGLPNPQNDNYYSGDDFVGRCYPRLSKRMWTFDDM